MDMMLTSVFQDRDVNYQHNRTHTTHSKSKGWGQFDFNPANSGAELAETYFCTPHVSFVLNYYDINNKSPSFA